MRFGTWNVRSMYRPRPLTTVARKVVRYRLDSVGMQEFRWDKGGAVQEMIILFFERMRWVEHVAHMGKRRVSYMVLMGDLRERNKQI
jgi:hypothetical protein